MKKELEELVEAAEAFLKFNTTPLGCAGWVREKILAAKGRLVREVGYKDPEVLMAEIVEGDAKWIAEKAAKENAERYARELEASLSAVRVEFDRHKERTRSCVSEPGNAWDVIVADRDEWKRRALEAEKREKRIVEAENDAFKRGWCERDAKANEEDAVAREANIAATARQWEAFSKVERERDDALLKLEEERKKLAQVADAVTFLLRVAGKF